MGRQRTKAAERVVQEGGHVTMAATEAKNQFGSLLDSVLQGRTITITRHNVPKAVVLPAEEYRALVRANSAGTVVAGLTRQFDTMLERMQRPAARAGVRAAFKAPPGELGRAASRAARRGR